MRVFLVYVILNTKLSLEQLLTQTLLLHNRAGTT